MFIFVYIKKDNDYDSILAAFNIYVNHSGMYNLRKIFDIVQNLQIL